MFRALGAGDFAEPPAAAPTRPPRSVAATRDADLTALGLCAQGRLALYAGRIAEGLALLDESMVRVIAGETSPVIAGHVYCTAIEGCQEISDFGRVAEWTLGARALVRRAAGAARLHRAVRRPPRPAVAAARRVGRARWTSSSSRPGATRRSAPRTPPGWRRTRPARCCGCAASTTEADAAYQRAADHGFDPQPGLALLWLARGQSAAASAAVDRLLAETAGPVQRCRLLPAAVEVLLAGR